MSEQTNQELPSVEQLKGMYRSMVLIRRFEETANDLYMQGKIPSTLHLYIGQEAVAVGVSASLNVDDYVLSTHRPHGHALAKGVEPRAIMAELFGKATGTCHGKGGSMHVGGMEVGMLPAIAIVGGNAPLTAGAALAFKMQKSKRVAVSYMGDGAANEGAVHEALNCAAIWNLPAVFVVENNLYGASTPFNTAFKIKNVSQRAEGYGMPGVIVDGNDVLAVYRKAREAIERARRGEGPTMLECMTYRQCGHSRSDPRTYRTHEEEEQWKLKDPIVNYRKRLLANHIVSEEEIAVMDKEVEEKILDAVAFAQASPEPVAADVYTDVFKEQPL
jgi:pyruvate dehydrogenase E1 component alpha subunit